VVNVELALVRDVYWRNAMRELSGEYEIYSPSTVVMITELVLKVNMSSLSNMH